MKPFWRLASRVRQVIKYILMQFTSDCQIRKKDWRNYFQSLLENVNFHSDSRDNVFMAQMFGLWSWFHFLVLQVCSTSQSWIPRNTITLNIRSETNINLGKKAKLDRPLIQGIKWKIEVLSVRHPPPHRLCLY